MVLWLRQEMLNLEILLMTDFDLRRAGMGGSDLPDLKEKNLVIYHMIEELYLWQDHKIQIVLIVNFLFVLKHLHF